MYATEATKLIEAHAAKYPDDEQLFFLYMAFQVSGLLTDSIDSLDW
jgi:hypothetical protein